MGLCAWIAKWMMQRGGRCCVLELPSRVDCGRAPAEAGSCVLEGRQEEGPASLAGGKGEASALLSGRKGEGTALLSGRKGEGSA
eukprot:1141959-Pelagomonas_calceolata.AAC.5